MYVNVTWKYTGQVFDYAAVTAILPDLNHLWALLIWTVIFSDEISEEFCGKLNFEKANKNNNNVCNPLPTGQ